MDFYIQLRDPFRSATRILCRVQEHLRRSGRFTNFEPVPNARIPILKCVHIATGFQCDLNFTNNIGVYNSPIMAQLLTFDSRIYVLAFIIKYWMKVHNLVGSNCITSYASLWLLLFYLQQLKEPMLPPIEVFQRNVPPFFIRGANMAFNFNLPNLLRNNQRVSELLLGFFQFYSTFDFENSLICPLYGCAFPQVNYEKLYPRYFARYRELLLMMPSLTPMQFDKPICIQDPFEITHTIPGKVSAEYYQIFRGALKNAARICNEKITTVGEGKELLLALFDNNLILPKEIVIEKKNSVKPKPKPNAQNQEKGGTVKVPNSSGLTADSAEYHDKLQTIKIVPEAEQLELLKIPVRRKHPNTAIDNKSKEIYAAWAELSIKYVVEILEKRFKFTLVERREKAFEDSKYSKTFDLSGDYGTGSAVCGSVRAIIHLWANIEDYRPLSIVLYDLNDNNGDNVFKEFQCELNNRIHSWVSERFSTSDNLAAELSITTYDTHLIRSQMGEESSYDTENGSKIQLARISATIHQKKLMEALLKTNHPDKPADDEAVNKLWSSNCIEFVSKVLSEICGFNLTRIEAFDDGKNGYVLSNTYLVVGEYNIFVGRTASDMNSPGFLSEQIRKTKQLLDGNTSKNGTKMKTPLQALFHIYTKDAVHVSIDVYNFAQGETITSQLSKRIRDYISAYFRNFSLMPENQASETGSGTQKAESVVSTESKNSSVAIARLPSTPPSRKLSCQLKPNQSVISIVEQLMQLTQINQEASLNNQVVQHRFWAQTCIGLVMKIFEEIFRFRVTTNINVTGPNITSLELEEPEYSKCVKLNGEYDVAHRRTKIALTKKNYLEEERDFSKKTTKKLKKPFAATVHVWAEPINFKYVSIDFLTLSTKELNFLIESRMSDYAHAYCKKYITDALITLKSNGVESALQ